MYLNFCFVYLLLQIFSPIPTLCSLTLKIDGEVEINAKKNYIYQISGLAVAKKDNAIRHDHPPHRIPVPNIEHLHKHSGSFKRSKTKYENKRAPHLIKTSSKDGRLYDANNSIKKITKNDPRSTDIRKTFSERSYKNKKKYGNHVHNSNAFDKHFNRQNLQTPSDEYVYKYYKNVTNETGTTTVVILYNKTHYIECDQNLPPMHNLYKIWAEQVSPKLFDDYFKPPWWMEYHKAPWWTQYHNQEQQGNNTWEIFHDFYDKHDAMNKYYMANQDKIPVNELTLVPESQPSELTKWLGELWQKLKPNSTKEDKVGKKVINLSFTLPHLWFQQRAENKNDRRNVPVYTSNPPLPMKQSETSDNGNEYHSRDKEIFKLFDMISKSRSGRYWLESLRNMPEMYQEKFRDIPRKSKSEKGSKTNNDEAVIGAIDSSNRMAVKLVQLMMDDLDKKGLLQQPVNDKSKENRMKWELDLACEKLGFCKPNSGIIHFTMDILNFIVSLQQDKFKIAFDTVLQIIKNTDLSSVLDDATIDGMKDNIEAIENEILLMQRTKIMIVNNIIKQYTFVEKIPILNSDPNNKSRKAFIEILNVLDQKVKNTDENLLDWDRLRNDLYEWDAGSSTRSIKRIAIDIIMHYQIILSELDDESIDIVKRNFKIIVE